MELSDYITFNSDWNNFKRDINREVRQFLMQPNVQQMIDNNEFRQVYNLASSQLRNHSLSILTYLLLKAELNIFGENPTNSFDSIHPGMFQYLAGIEYLYLPDTVEEIGAHAFQGSGIKAIRFPNNLRTIYLDACSHSSPTKLDIIYSGTNDEWNVVDTDMPWHTNTQLNIACTNGVIIHRDGD